MGTPSGDGAHGPVNGEGTNDGTAQGSSQGADETPSRSTRLKWLQSPWSVAVGSTVIGGLLVVAILNSIHFFDHSAASASHHAKSSPAQAANLSVDSTTLTSCANTPRCHTHSGLGPEIADIKIRNSGNGIADITQAHVKVQQIMRLGKLSFPNGAIVPLDGTYKVALPFQSGQSVSGKLNEMVNPNAIARFDLSFVPPHLAARINLYRVSISLVYNGIATMTPIEMLVSVPRDPPLADKCSAAHQQLCAFLRSPGSRDVRLGQLTP